MFKHVFDPPESKTGGYVCRFCGVTIHPKVKEASVRIIPLGLATCEKSNVKILFPEQETQKVNCLIEISDNFSIKPLKETNGKVRYHKNKEGHGRL